MKGLIIKEILQDFCLGESKMDFDSYEFNSISDKHSLKSGSVYFCGKLTFWEALSQSSVKDLLIIFDKKFFDESGEDIKKALENYSSWGTVENLPLAMSHLSGPFYRELSANDNDEVDGRQMGTCDIHPTAVISQGVFLGANVKVGRDVRLYPGCVVSSFCEIDEGTTLFPNVTLMPRTKIGKACRIHSGTVIGSDGFGYNFAGGVHHKVWHIGGVLIGDNVEIGSNSSVDQGTFSPTQIHSGTKIDNLVQVAHNVQLGLGTILCGQAGVAGSASVGDFTVVGGRGAIAPDCHVGKGCQIGGRAGVMNNLEDGAIVAGFPARPIKEWLKGLAYVRKMTLKK
ncbi:MAG: UDP-3-O-(3-hydroxymyristoyl)glucosamine N-acyltransferase [Bacteriovoracaceae bacterium]|nr:UDP-3-O-(3-hydroxymyristoyl)glucosamine N-acyltransferase [Bacteriovoracaceae bacterium]